jgi:Holliday junction resolvase RusA-like endonuclease
LKGPKSTQVTASDNTQQSRKPDFYFRTKIESHVVKKNNRPIHGRGQKKWIGKSTRLRNAEQWLGLALKSYANQIGFNAALVGDLHIIFRFYFKDYFTKQNKRSRTMPDLSNLIELPADCLQSAGIIENDTDIVSFNGTGRFPGKQNELEIEIYVIQDGLWGHVPNG